MALMGRATHVLQWGVQRVAKPRGGANLTKLLVVRIGVCNSLHEVGIASNRGSERRGEYVPGVLYTPPVIPWEWVAPEVGSLT